MTSSENNSTDIDEHESDLTTAREIELNGSELIQYQKDYREKIRCDATIEVEGEDFKAHWKVLCTLSLTFRNYYDEQGGSRSKITFDNLKKDAFSACLDYLYYRQDEDILQNYNKEDMLEAASTLGIEKLQEICQQHFISELNTNNCVKLFDLSYRYECLPKLAELSMSLIEVNASSVLENKEDIVKLDIGSLRKIFQSQELWLDYEVELFGVLVDWISHDKEDRNTEFCDLLELIKLPMFDKEYLNDRVKEHPHIRDKNCPTCKEYLHDTWSYLNNEEHTSLTITQLTPRRSNTFGNFLVASCNNWAAFNLSKTPVVKKDLNNIPEMGKDPQLRYKCIAFYHNTIYLIDNKKSGKCYYNELNKNNIWQKIPRMPKKHHEHDVGFSSVTVFNKCIMCIGGTSSSDDLNRVDCYNIKKNWWQEFKPMITKRKSCTVVATRTELYVIGGYNWTSKNLDSVEKYSLKNKRWEKIPPLNVPRQYPSACIFKNKKIFVAGGFDYETLSSVETFEIGNTNWTAIKNLNVARYSCSIFIFENKVHVFGGERKIGQRLYEVWDDGDGTWKPSELICEGIMGCQVFDSFLPQEILFGDYERSTAVSLLQSLHSFQLE